MRFFHKLLLMFRSKDIAHTHFISKISDEYAIPNEKFLNNYVVPTQEARKLWKKSRIEFEITKTRLESYIETKPKDLDPIKLYISQSQHHFSSIKEMGLYEEICDKLGDTLWQRDINLISSHSNYMMSYFTYLESSYKECCEIEPFLQELDTNIRNKSIEYEELQNQRENEKMREAELEYEERYAPLIELLSSEDLALVNAVVVTAGSEQDQILSLVIQILDAFKKTMPIIQLTITREVEGTTDATTLFRANTCATKLMSQFVKMTGGNYFSETVNHLILEVIKEPNGYEVDPDKSQGEDLKLNMQRLIAMTKKFLDSIIDSFNRSFPIAFRLISSHLRAEVEKKISSSKTHCCRRIYFLKILLSWCHVSRFTRIN